MSGAQYGYYDPITPWHKYLETRVMRVISVQCTGHCRDEFLDLRSSADILEAAVSTLNGEAHKCIKSATIKWQEEYHFTVKKMLKLSGTALEHRQKELITYIKNDIQSFIRYLEEQKAREEESGN